MPRRQLRIVVAGADDDGVAERAHAMQVEDVLLAGHRIATRRRGWRSKNSRLSTEITNGNRGSASVALQIGRIRDPIISVTRHPAASTSQRENSLLRLPRGGRLGCPRSTQSAASVCGRWSATPGRRRAAPARRRGQRDRARGSRLPVIAVLVLACVGNVSDSNTSFTRVLHWTGPLLLQCPHEEATQAPQRRVSARGRDADDGVRVAPRPAAAGRAAQRPPARRAARKATARVACSRRPRRRPGGAGGTVRARRHEHDCRQPGCVLRPGGHDHRVDRRDVLEVDLRRRPAPRRWRAGSRRGRPTSSCWC